jgi:hypothetical protein
VRCGKALQQRHQAGQRARVSDALLVRLLDGEQADGKARLLLEIITTAEMRDAWREMRARENG